MKDKNHMFISIDTEKILAKIQHSFMMKNIQQLGKEVNFLNLIKNINKELRANIILKGERVNTSTP